MEEARDHVLGNFAITPAHQCNASCAIESLSTYVGRHTGSLRELPSVVTRRAAVKLALEKRYLRWGQAVFNAASDLYPEIAEQLRNSGLDPFHQNGLVDPFLMALDGLVNDVSE